MASPNTAAIAKRVWSDPVTAADIQTLANGIATRLDGQPTVLLAEFDALYAEPMYLALPSNPIGLECIRVRETKAQEEVVVSGSAVFWVWNATRAKILSIDGMSVGSGALYTFTFRATFAPVSS